MISRSTFDNIATLRRPTSSVAVDLGGHRASLADIGLWPRARASSDVRRDRIADEPDAEDNVDPPYSGRGSRGGRGGPGRRVLKIGVGGFCVRGSKHKTAAITTSASLDEKDYAAAPTAGGGGGGDDEDASGVSAGGKRARRPRRPRRPKLEEAYPPVIQDEFFGM